VGFSGLLVYLRLEVGADLGRRETGSCGVLAVLVRVHLSRNDGLEHAFAAWLGTDGEITPAEGERVDPATDWQGSLAVTTGPPMFVRPTRPRDHPLRPLRAGAVLLQVKDSR
jgi:hypothetical protein